MPQHQCLFSEVLAEIYEPLTDEEVDQARAALDYSKASQDMQEELLLHIV